MSPNKELRNADRRRCGPLRLVLCEACWPPCSSPVHPHPKSDRYDCQREWVALDRQTTAAGSGAVHRRAGIVRQTDLRASGLSVCFVRCTGRAMGSPVRFDSPECLPGRWHRGKRQSRWFLIHELAALLCAPASAARSSRPAQEAEGAGGRPSFLNCLGCYLQPWGNAPVGIGAGRALS